MPIPSFNLVNLLFFAGVPTISPSLASPLLAAGAFAVAGAGAFVELVVELSDFDADWQPHSRQAEPIAIATSGRNLK
jgi:hypothetical protein